MARKILVFFLIGFFFTGNILAQVYWLNKLDVAKKIANSSNRLILIDFWASWCGPCKVMDAELWQSSEAQKISRNFVGVKINVDLEKSLVAYYKVKSIPKVIIITVTGDIIWEKAGYDNAESYVSVFKSIPEDVGELNKKFKVLAGDRENLQANYSTGIELQSLGKNIKNSELKDSFLYCSGQYLAKALKLCNDPVMTEEIELNSILNDVYGGRYQKALSMIEKMDPQPQNESMTEFRHYILALCYRSANDQDNYNKEKNLITKKEFLDQLED